MPPSPPADSTACITDGDAYCWGTAHLVSWATAVRPRFTPQPVSGWPRRPSPPAGITVASPPTATPTAGVRRIWLAGNGDTVDHSTPQPVSGDLTFAHIAAGVYHTCGTTDGDAMLVTAQMVSWATAWSFHLCQCPVVCHRRRRLYHTRGITTDGDAYCWGHGAFGQLGSGTTAIHTPASVR